MPDDAVVCVCGADEDEDAGAGKLPPVDVGAGVDGEGVGVGIDAGVGCVVGGIVVVGGVDGDDAVHVVQYSYEPMSYADPWGRTMPLWSLVTIVETSEEPVLMAGEDDWRRRSPEDESINLGSPLTAEVSIEGIAVPPKYALLCIENDPTLLLPVV